MLPTPWKVPSRNVPSSGGGIEKKVSLRPASGNVVGGWEWVAGLLDVAAKIYLQRVCGPNEKTACSSGSVGSVESSE